MLAPRTIRDSLLAGTLGLVYHAALLGLLFATGGAAYLLAADALAPFPEDAPQALSASGMVALCGLLTLVVAVPLARRSRKRFVFGTLCLLLLTPLTLFACELLARSFVPAWPALGLHGVRPDPVSPWWKTGPSVMPGSAHPDGLPGGTVINSWGQRDYPRTVRPVRGVRRIAFIGDSFLEESTDVPLSMLVEQQLGSRDNEVLNLGVSATDPDEYYYRTRQIALPLGAEHCVLFIYAGNDLTGQLRTLETHLGIAAVYPRGSLLSTCGLLGLNHLLTNAERPVLRIWQGAGDLRRNEEQLASRIRRCDDKSLRQLLFSLVQGYLWPAQQQHLAERLTRVEMGPFLTMLRHPDKELFRSYYLWPALQVAAVPGTRWEPLHPEVAAQWVTQTRNVCQKHGSALTVAIIPEAFQVDSRMREQWAPLADMRDMTRSSRTAAEQLLIRLRAEGIQVIDLHESLQDVPGTYLNLDGHWSERGVRLVAEVLAKALRE